jgi:ATP synthase protein I
MMSRVVLAQFVAAVALGLAGAAVGGGAAGWTALLGGLACAVPNALFALNLAVLGRVRGSAQAPSADAAAALLTLLLGEFCKVLLTAALLALVVWMYKDVVWPALIASVCAVLLVQAFALAWRRN